MLPGGGRGLLGKREGPKGSDRAVPSDSETWERLAVRSYVEGRWGLGRGLSISVVLMSVSDGTQRCQKK